MITSVRPHKVFKIYQTVTQYERMVKIVLPGSVHSSPVLLETAILITFAKTIEPERSFEFGTYLGTQSMNIVANLPNDSQLYTLDLDELSFTKATQLTEDKILSKTHFEYEDNITFLNTPYENRITRLYGDSNTFDFSQFYSKIDMIYIDGGHDLRTVTNDSKNAFKMLSKDHISCILWHDYNSDIYPILMLLYILISYRKILISFMLKKPKFVFT